MKCTKHFFERKDGHYQSNSSSCTDRCFSRAPSEVSLVNAARLLIHSHCARVLDMRLQSLATSQFHLRTEGRNIPFALYLRFSQPRSNKNSNQSFLVQLDQAPALLRTLQALELSWARSCGLRILGNFVGIDSSLAPKKELEAIRGRDGAGVSEVAASTARKGRLEQCTGNVQRCGRNGT